MSSEVNLEEQLWESFMSRKSLYIEEEEEDDEEDDVLSILEVLRVLLKGEKMDGEKREVKLSL